MKKLSLVIAAVVVALASLSAQAANVPAPFNVQITLTSACTISSPIPNTVALSYTSGQTTAVAGTTSTVVQCTNSLPYTLSLNGLKGAGNYGPLTDTSTGLNYTLAFNTSGTGGADAGPFTATGAPQLYTIGVGISQLQFGTCAGAICTGTPQAQTVYINY